jgi:argininosuccinate synthase
MQQYWKEQLGNWYGMLFHEGQFLDPVTQHRGIFRRYSKNSKRNRHCFLETSPLDGIESEMT